MCQVKLRPVVGSRQSMEIGSGPRLTRSEWTLSVAVWPVKVNAPRLGNV